MMMMTFIIMIMTFIIIMIMTFIIIRINIRKKWWYPIYLWSLNVAAVNAWRLRQMRMGKFEPYLLFLRELVQSPAVRASVR